jgi:hypothetical protein
MYEVYAYHVNLLGEKYLVSLVTIKEAGVGVNVEKSS